MAGTKLRYKVVIVAPTCFYYQVTLFRKLAAHPRIDLLVCFCSDESLYARDVHEMYKTDSSWGDEGQLLDGFKYKFLKNRSLSPSYLKWPFGLINPGIWSEIREERPDVVILMSWMNLTWWIAVSVCLRYGVPFLYMTDANIQAELVGRRWKKWIKSFMLGKLLFPLATGFLCAGTANHLLYRFYGVPEEKLVPFAYSWGYEPFLQISEGLRLRKKELRAALGLPEEGFVILFCGRLSKEKDPFALLEAYRRVKNRNKTLIFVGDGELNNPLKDYVAEHNLESVHFFGFQGRREIAKFYAVSDALVLPSHRETWGIVVNEALCFRLPVIVSDQVGAGRDLVRDGQNGYRFPAGDVEMLAERINQLMDLPEDKRTLMGIMSLKMITGWAERDLPGSLDAYLDYVYSKK